MPKKQPTMSYTHIRDFAERWEWKDRQGTTHVGYNPPDDAIDPHRQPFRLKALTSNGHIIEGRAVTLKVNTSLLSRMVQFIDTDDIRWVFDKFIIEIDGVRFFAH